MLLKLKCFIHEYVDKQTHLAKNERKGWIYIVNLTENEWKALEKIVEVFDSAYLLTKQLQKTACTLSDFYGSWLRMEMAVRKCLNSAANDEDEDDEILLDLPQRMLEAMDRYRDRLLNNPMLLAAVFLDPRFSSYLKVPYKTLAVAKLVKLYEEIRKRKLDTAGAQDEDDLECYLAEIGGNYEGFTDGPKLHDLLEQFTQQPPEKSKVDVLDYWEQNKTAKPELYLLSRVVFCVAPTQAATERANSGLSFVFTRYRSNLGQTKLEDILVVRSNADLFDCIVRERLEKFL